MSSQTMAVSAPISAGSCTLHSGRTLHYTRGNCTGRDRRALIVNFRPEAMVALERSLGFDHGKQGVSAFDAIASAKKDTRMTV